MGKAIWHAKSSAKMFGGKPEDYLDIHTLIDSSRDAFPDLRHRALTHTSWFIGEIIPKIFGEKRKNSAGKFYAVREVAEHHVLEDFDNLYIPSVQDYLADMELQPWMDNARDGATPPSRKKLAGEKKVGPSRQVPKLKDIKKLEVKPDKDWSKIFEKARELQRSDGFRNRPCARAGRGVMD